MALYIILGHFPRTTTRKEWREKWSTYRRLKREQKVREKEEIALLQTVTDHSVRREIIDRIIYPPICVIGDIR